MQLDADGTNRDAQIAMGAIANTHIRFQISATHYWQAEITNYVGIGHTASGHQYYTYGFTNSSVMGALSDGLLTTLYERDLVGGAEWLAEYDDHEEYGITITSPDEVQTRRDGEWVQVLANFPDGHSGAQVQALIDTHAADSDAHHTLPVGMAQIANRAVTLGKLAVGTAGKFLGFDAAGDPAELDAPQGGGGGGVTFGDGSGEVSEIAEGDNTDPWPLSKLGGDQELTTLPMRMAWRALSSQPSSAELSGGDSVSGTTDGLAIPEVPEVVGNIRLDAWVATNEQDRIRGFVAPFAFTLVGAFNVAGTDGRLYTSPLLTSDDRLVVEGSIVRCNLQPSHIDDHIQNEIHETLYDKFKANPGGSDLPDLTSLEVLGKDYELSDPAAVNANTAHRGIASIHHPPDYGHAVIEAAANTTIVPALQNDGTLHYYQGTTDATYTVNTPPTAVDEWHAHFWNTTTHDVTVSAAGVSMGTVAPMTVALLIWESNAFTFYLEPHGLSDIPDGGVDTAKLADGAVTTPKIADNAVSLAKMASGTAGKYLGYDTSGDPAELDAPSGSGSETPAAASIVLASTSIPNAGDAMADSTEVTLTEAFENGSLYEFAEDGTGPDSAQIFSGEYILGRAAQATEPTTSAAAFTFSIRRNGTALTERAERPFYAWLGSANNKLWVRPVDAGANVNLVIRKLPRGGAASVNTPELKDLRALRDAGSIVPFTVHATLLNNHPTVANGSLLNDGDLTTGVAFIDTGRAVTLRWNRKVRRPRVHIWADGASTFDLRGVNSNGHDSGTIASVASANGHTVWDMGDADYYGAFIVRNSGADDVVVYLVYIEDTRLNEVTYDSDTRTITGTGVTLPENWQDQEARDDAADALAIANFADTGVNRNAHAIDVLRNSIHPDTHPDDLSPDYGTPINYSTVDWEIPAGHWVLTATLLAQIGTTGSSFTGTVTLSGAISKTINWTTTAMTFVAAYLEEEVTLEEDTTLTATLAVTNPSGTSIGFYHQRDGYNEIQLTVVGFATTRDLETETAARQSEDSNLQNQIENIRSIPSGHDSSLDFLHRYRPVDATFTMQSRAGVGFGYRQAFGDGQGVRSQLGSFALNDNSQGELPSDVFQIDYVSVSDVEEGVQLQHRLTMRIAELITDRKYNTTLYRYGDGISGTWHYLHRNADGHNIYYSDILPSAQRPPNITDDFVVNFNLEDVEYIRHGSDSIYGIPYVFYITADHADAPPLAQSRDMSQMARGAGTTQDSIDFTEAMTLNTQMRERLAAGFSAKITATINIKAGSNANVTNKIRTRDAGGTTLVDRATSVHVQGTDGDQDVIEYILTGLPNVDLIDIQIQRNGATTFEIDSTIIDLEAIPPQETFVDANVTATGIRFQRKRGGEGSGAVKDLSLEGADWLVSGGPRRTEIHDANETIGTNTTNWQALSTPDAWPSLTDNDWYAVSPGVFTGGQDNRRGSIWVQGSAIGALTVGTVGSARTAAQELDIGFGIVVGRDANNNIILGGHTANRNPTPLKIVHFNYAQSAGDSPSGQVTSESRLLLFFVRSTTTPVPDSGLTYNGNNLIGMTNGIQPNIPSGSDPLWALTIRATRAAGSTLWALGTWNIIRAQDGTLAGIQYTLNAEADTIDWTASEAAARLVTRGGWRVRLADGTWTPAVRFTPPSQLEWQQLFTPVQWATTASTSMKAVTPFHPADFEDYRFEIEELSTWNGTLLNGRGIYVARDDLRPVVTQTAATAGVPDPLAYDTGNAMRFQWDRRGASVYRSNFYGLSGLAADENAFNFLFMNYDGDAGYCNYVQIGPLAQGAFMKFGIYAR